MIPVSAVGISFDFDPAGGFVRRLRISDGGRTIAPLHVAPWVGTDEQLPPGIPLHLRGIEGDFFCAPFARVEGESTMHGWPANGMWAVQDAPVLRAVLDHAVSGATLVKELAVADGHPFIYQRHVFIGGTGTIPVANHAMVTLPAGGTLRFSLKRWFETSPNPQETDPARGRSALLYPARSPDPAAVPLAAGGTVDVRGYPWRTGHEDFIVGVEAPGHDLGWTAVTRTGQGDLYLSLRHARHLPMTMLWHSDAGRDYAPWNGRHRHCLGVEEGAAVHMLGIGAGETPDPLTAAGQSPGLALRPDGVAEVRHVIGAIAWPSGEPVATIRASGDSLLVTGEGGASRTLPWHGQFLSA